MPVTQEADAGDGDAVAGLQSVEDFDRLPVAAPTLTGRRSTTLSLPMTHATASPSASFKTAEIGTTIVFAEDAGAPVGDA